MTTEQNDNVNLELEAFTPASAVYDRHSSEDDEEATIGWEEDDLDKEGLLSSGGSSPTLAGEGFEAISKINDGQATTTWQKELKIMFKTAPPLCMMLTSSRY
jgi:hypothetical protein